MSKKAVKSFLGKIGFEVQRSDPSRTYPKRRQLALVDRNVDLVLDVGAHAGEFAQSLRHHGYDGKIRSFEPLQKLYTRLEIAAKRDSDWSCHKLAVGNRAGSIEMNISGNDGFSSSVLQMLPQHQLADPSSAYVAAEVVELTTLDAQVSTSLGGCSTFLKVDTQGFEKEVIEGAAETLNHCALIELELALVELYEGQALFDEMVGLLEKKGFVLNDLEPGFRDDGTGRLLQVDALFVCRERSPGA